MSAFEGLNGMAVLYLRSGISEAIRMLEARISADKLKNLRPDVEAYFEDQKTKQLEALSELRRFHDGLTEFDFERMRRKRAEQDRPASP